MAQRVITIDDFDGTMSDEMEKIPFVFDGYSYVIDLTPVHAKEFRQHMKRYTEAAHIKERAHSTKGKQGKARVWPDDLPPMKVVREWARENLGGIMPIPKAGFLSDEVIAKYREAHGNA